VDNKVQIPSGTLENHRRGRALDRGVRSARERERVADREAIRVAAFDFLARQSRVFPDTLPWKVLSEGFVYDGRRIPLIGPQGIFKPAYRTPPGIPRRDAHRADGGLLTAESRLPGGTVRHVPESVVA
jgi:putative restriction endonuclease